MKIDLSRLHSDVQLIADYILDTVYDRRQGLGPDTNRTPSKSPDIVRTFAI